MIFQSRTTRRSLSMRAWLAASALLILTGCGFQPLYGSAAYRNLAGLEINAGPERIDYLVEDALADYFGVGTSPYRLELINTLTEQVLGVSATARVRRYRMTVRTDYVLFLAGNQIDSGVIAEDVYFDAPAEAYSLIAARAASESDGANAVARRLADRVAVAMRRAEAGRERS